MRYKIILLLFFWLITISGCQHHDLDTAFSDYFLLINQSKDKSQIISAKHDLENIVHELEQEQNPHLADFQYLLNLFRAAEISWSVDDPKRMKKIIRAGMHPASSAQMLNRYQRAPHPQHFSQAKHMTALHAALDLSQKSEFVAGAKKYYFRDLMRKWLEIKQIQTKTDAAKKLSKSLEGGVCGGVAMRANQLFCEDSSRSAASIIDAINKDYDQTLLYQIQGNIAARLIRKDGVKLGEAYMQSLQERVDIYATLPGFWLKSRVRLFMDKVISAAIEQNLDFAARISFRGNKTGHAIAIQILKGGEFRIIDNNIGVLSFDNKQDFLEVFANYRLPYYVGHSRPFMIIFGAYCSRQTE